ncbi:uncharacterized protein LOC119452325 [Dermacentor silvarum]|uniref:uncharacterized protein LOC119452325 n=1 Tax=Dermacentor silvarum TaxID=543639 RepID=UPI002100BA15|nr:uncharacterized protein LOC119452325 [Dermacentor silvarum]
MRRREFFSRLPIASVAGTQRLSEVVRSALVGFFIAIKMTKRLEQRYCIKFCQKLGDSQVETIRKIETAFGHDAMSSPQMKEWYIRFKDGRTSVESEPRSGQPSTCRNDQVIAEVNAVVMRDRRVTIREIAEEVGITTFSAHPIMVEDLAMKIVAAKFMPKLLTLEQKQLRVEVSQYMLDSTNSDPDFMNTIITGDASWVYGYDPETKSQSSQWKHSTSPRPKKARQVRSNVKVMLTAFFDSRGVVHHEKTVWPHIFIGLGHYVNGDNTFTDCCIMPPTVVMRPAQVATDNSSYQHDLAMVVGSFDMLTSNSTPPVWAISVTMKGRWTVAEAEETPNFLSRCVHDPSAESFGNIAQVCNDPDFERVVNDLQLHSTLTYGDNHSRVFSYDDEYAFREKLCRLKAEHTSIEFGIAVFDLEYEDFSNSCSFANSRGAFSRLKLLRLLIDFFSTKFHDQTDFAACSSLTR